MCMRVKPGMRGLDAGCGIGEPARQFARWADVHVTGISINQIHADRANYLAEQEGLSDKTDFIRADFCVRALCHDSERTCITDFKP